MRLVPEPISQAGFRPFGMLMPRPAEAGRTVLSEMISWTDPEAWLRASLSLIDPIAPPLVASKMERHRYSCQLFLPVEVGRYLVVVAPDNGDAPDPRGACAFFVPGDLGIVYAIGTWHCPMCVIGARGTFVVLMAVSGTECDEEWSSLAEPIEVSIG